MAGDAAPVVAEEGEGRVAKEGGRLVAGVGKGEYNGGSRLEEGVRRGSAGGGPRDGRDGDCPGQWHGLEAHDTAGGGVPCAYGRGLVGGGAEEVRLVVGWGRGEVNEGGVRSRVATVGAGGRGDERGIGVGRLERPR